MSEEQQTGNCGDEESIIYTLLQFSPQKGPFGQKYPGKKKIKYRAADRNN